ncbi:MAG: hypothetical protein A4E59_00109 [Syntrophorhabdus sp. PtaB.Bin027]|nr:MAG: hypothetical protein A4E59_00109 [Syntrophorhabdus sp. PtaB.Bin027]
MNFNLGQLVASGRLQFLILIFQICFIIFLLITLFKKTKNRSLTYLLLSILYFSVIISMFYHHLDGIKLFESSSGFCETVYSADVLTGLIGRHVFFSYEMIVGIIGLIITLIFLYFKKD